MVYTQQVSLAEIVSWKTFQTVAIASVRGPNLQRIQICEATTNIFMSVMSALSYSQFRALFVSPCCRSEIEAADQNDSRGSNDPSSSTPQGSKHSVDNSEGSRPRVASVGGRLDLNSKGTPGKLILPKMAGKLNQGSSSCPTTPQGHGCKSKSATGSASAAVTSGSSAQQILVFSPNAHASQLNTQSLFILSPVNQKGGSSGQLQQGAIQTTQQVNIIPPTKENGVAQLQTVSGQNQSSPDSNASPGSSTAQVLATSQSTAVPAVQTGVVLTKASTASTAVGAQAGVVLTTTPQLTATAVSAPAVLQFVSTGPTTIVAAQSQSKVTSHVTTTSTSQGQVAVQVQHTPSDSKPKVKTMSVTNSTKSITSTTAVISAAAKPLSGPILTKENAHSLLSDQFNSRRSLLFEKGSSTANSPGTDKTNSSVAKKSVLSLPQKQVNGHSNLSQRPGVASNEVVKLVGSPTASVKSPLSGTDQDRQLNKGNRFLNKTVSSLLKEQRGVYGGVSTDLKTAYVNDRRPVSELLRESRQRQHKQQRQESQNQSPSAVAVSGTTSNTDSAPTTSASNTIYVRRNSSGAVTSAQTPVMQAKNNAVHLVNIPKNSNNGAKDDVISPNVSLAPKRTLSGEINVSRKRIRSGDDNQHYNLVHTPRGTLELLKTEPSPDGSLKVKLLPRPLPSDFSGIVRPSVSKSQSTATVTSASAGAASVTNAGTRLLRQESRKRDVSICSDKDGFDFVGMDPDMDIADINPSITQMVGANGQELRVKTSGNEEGNTGPGTSAAALYLKLAAQSNGGNVQPQTPGAQQQVTLQSLLSSMDASTSHGLPANCRKVLQTAIAQGQTQGQAVEALAALLASQQVQQSASHQDQNGVANAQTQLLQQQQNNAQLQQQTSGDYDSGLNLQETNDQFTSNVSTQQQQKFSLNVAQLNELLTGVSSENTIPALKQDVLLSEAADTFQGRLLRSRSLSGPAQRKPPLSGATSVEEMVRQRSMSTIGFAGPGLNLSTNVLNTLQQVVAAQGGCNSVPQSPLCSTSIQPQQPAMVGGAGQGSMPNSRRSSFVGSVCSSPVGMMSPGGPNSSHCSASSTPISAYRSLGPSPVELSSAFMPIQNSYQDQSTGVNLVRPMVTMASVLGQQTSISNPQMAQAPLLQGIGEGSRFVPYPLGMASKEQQNLQQQLGSAGLDLSLNSQFNLQSALLQQTANQQQQQNRNPPPAYNIAVQPQQTGFHSASGQMTLSEMNPTPPATNGQLSLPQRLGLGNAGNQSLVQQRLMKQQQRSGMAANTVAVTQSALQQKLAEPLPPSHINLQEKLLEQQKLLAKSKEDAKFAPVSSIKPLKRGGKGSKPAASAKRQRHRSAQPAIGQSDSASFLIK